LSEKTDNGTEKSVQKEEKIDTDCSNINKDDSSKN
jgi:hypothetical protein